MNIDATTSLYAVFGNPVEHSLSPVVFNAAFRHSGLASVYVAFRVTDIQRGAEAIRTLGIRGVSITIPHKETILACLDDIDDLAKRIGAVNTVVNREGRLIGYNTDGIGAVQALKTIVDPSKASVLLVGAGGAARAIGTVLVQEGASVSVTNRHAERGLRLCRDIGARWVPSERMDRWEGDVVIQTTPVGMWPHVEASPVPAFAFREGMVAMDIVYVPEETRFLREARRAGCHIVAGTEMFLNQAAAQFTLWTGKVAPMEVMRLALQEGLHHRKGEGSG